MMILTNKIHTCIPMDALLIPASLKSLQYQTEASCKSYSQWPIL